MSILSLKLVIDAQNSGCNGGFWVRNLLSSTQASYCVNAKLVSSTTNMDLYLDNNLTTNLNYSNITNAFETNIFPIERDAYGSPSDINGDKKVTVLILDIKDGSSANTGFIAGYVDPINFYIDSPGSGLRSNQREILFMDGVELVALRDRDLANGKPDTFLSTLAHEFQHLIRFQYSRGTDDTWIDEGTSEVTSDLTGYGPQSARFSCFKGDANSSSACLGGIGSTSLGSPSLFNWSGTLKNYAYAYTFMKYIYESSGSNSTSRNTFFRQTVQGNNGVRGNTAYNLISLFMGSSNFNANVLNSDNKTTFKMLMASFLGQAVGYSNLNNVYFGNTTPVNIDSVRTTYPFSSTLTLLSSPNPFSGINTSSFNLSPSQVSRVIKSTTGVTSNSSDIVIVSNGSSGANTEFVIFNGDNVGSRTATTSATASTLELISYPELDLKDTDGIICPNSHFSKLNEIDQKRLDLKLYQKK
ncbi:MAG TPA: hypothetical protein PKL30_14310 [Leptospiraceae bacterium]|nr:hypothetical protein [Leptospiraceae bacterium]HNB99817.1 hypothetical protein [Leptospiraceae bacterium]HNE10388.1 hypothetical protein [Leptospiraceae bacterium]HNF57255.1 hypothetical protein [Leptospiraceae bacterium]HNH01745.1 hypothetical protein [Leptospiraceae bacterium]